MKRYLAAVFIVWTMISCTMPLVWEQTPEPAVTPTQQLATLRATHPIEPEPTETIRPLDTPAVSATAAPTEGVLTPTAPTVTLPFYSLQAGSPILVHDFSHAGQDCGWFGVGGQVFNFQHHPADDILVEAGGRLGQDEVLQMSLVGSAETTYGPGGFEIALGDRPVESQRTLWLQLFTMDGDPVSEKIYFDTLADCQRNLILANFIEQPSRANIATFLPGIVKSYRAK